MLIDYILIKENTAELLVIGNYDNNLTYIVDDVEITPSNVRKIWRLDKKSLQYVNDTYRIIISINFTKLEIKLSNVKFNLANFKNLKKGKYEYHKYKMYLDQDSIFIHKKNIIRRR